MDDNSNVSACEHLLANPESDYYWYLNGKGPESFLLCEACRKDATHKGVKLNVRRIGLDELKLINQEGYLDGVSGEVTVQECPVSHLPPVRFIELPGTPVLTMAARPDRSWLLYSASHELAIFDPDNGLRKKLMSVSLPEEIDEAWCNRHLTPRLHCDPSGRFAALVHDYGRYGLVIDLLEKRITMTLDGGDYHPKTVPFSLSFIIHNERPVIIHRTAWNRLDASDPETGRLLTARGPTNDQSGEEQPAHYLDYFHGGLYLSPSGTRMLDDGWVWSPVGVLGHFEPENWLSGNVWETEDKVRAQNFPLQREDWDIGICWINDEQFVIQVLLSDNASAKNQVAFLCHISSDEITPIAGAGGRFFSDGMHLFSANAEGLSVWNIEQGSRAGLIVGFSPTFTHPRRPELVQISSEGILCWQWPEIGISNNFRVESE